MKRGIALLLALCMLMTLSACGKKNKKEKAEEASATPTPIPNEAFEVKITLDNLYQYFDYKEFRADVRDENSSEINSSTVAYGLQLKEMFTAANDPRHRDTMTLTFEADGVVMSGDFDIDFNTLTYTGTPTTTEHTHVKEQLHFWAKGDRTTTWAFGNYSATIIMYFERFAVTEATGSVWLKRAEPHDPTPTPIPTPTPRG